jgi:hypothetical protein
MRYSKLLLVTLIALLLLTALASSAFARRFSLSNGNYRIVWTSLEFAYREPSGGTITFSCPITLEGSFHSRTFSKVSGQLLSFIDRVFFNNAACTGAQVRVLTETLPWHIRYHSFIGVLPTITGIRVELVGAAFLFVIGGIMECLFASTAALPMYAILNREASGVIRTLRLDESVLLPLSTTAPLNSLLCPSGIGYHGTGEVFLRGSATTRITVSLIQ